jgi:hypothetical protein
MRKYLANCGMTSLILLKSIALRANKERMRRCGSDNLLPSLASLSNKKSARDSVPTI